MDSVKCKNSSACRNWSKKYSTKASAPPLRAESPKERAAKLMKVLARDKDALRRADAAEDLGDMGAWDAVPALTEALKDPSADVRIAATYALTKLKDHAQPAVPALKEMMADPNSLVRYNAVVALQDLVGYRETFTPALTAALLKRREAASPNKAFDALIDRDGKLITGNLPSWPLVRRGNWVTIEADLYRDGDEDDHEALSRDILLGDGRRLIVGRDVEVFADRKELMNEASRWGSLSVVLFGLLGGKHAADTAQQG